MTIRLSGDLVDKLTELATNLASEKDEAATIAWFVEQLESMITVEVENHLVASVENSYAEHPVSITEERATRAGLGDLWTPRDCLLQMLRDVDQGEIKPIDLVVAYSEQVEENVMGVHTRTACRTFFNSIALLEIAKAVTIT